MIVRYNLNYEKTSLDKLIEFLLYLIVNSIVLLMASSLFENFYISTFWYAILASFVIFILNKTIKPLLIFFTLPVTVFTVGLFYPFINVFILKISAWIIGPNFIVDGLIVPFFIALFISIMNIILESIIIKPITERRR